MNNKKFKKIDIKNCTCYYSDDIININDMDLNIFLDEKSYENIYGVAYKTRYGTNPLGITFNTVHGYIRKYYNTKERNFDRIKYLIVLKRQDFIHFFS